MVITVFTFHILKTILHLSIRQHRSCRYQPYALLPTSTAQPDPGIKVFALR